MQSLWGIAGGTPRCGTSRCPCGFAAALSTSFPAGVGLSSIFSGADEVTGWRYCIDPEAHNYEVRGNHLSLLVNRHVYRLVGEILAGHGEADRAVLDVAIARKPVSAPRAGPRSAIRILIELTGRE